MLQVGGDHSAASENVKGMGVWLRRAQLSWKHCVSLTDAWCRSPHPFSAIQPTALLFAQYVTFLWPLIGYQADCNYQKGMCQV